ncbi:MAG: hypothetical protein J6B50_07610 [Lachnospiraceae bacterium]|nr:hypothetical protein [Lachnospiraceae bacterium]MBP3506768.1 hypothetical protein [Lachnospiraceae bacterium]
MYIVEYESQIYVKKEHVNFITVLGKKAGYQKTRVSLQINHSNLKALFHTVDSGYGKRARLYTLCRDDVESCEYSRELHCIRFFGEMAVSEYESAEKTEEAIRKTRRKQELFLYISTDDEAIIANEIKMWAGSRWTDMDE